MPPGTLPDWLAFGGGQSCRSASRSSRSTRAVSPPQSVHDQPIVWGTFYDIRRYGGLQIFFRALIDGGSFVLSNAKEAPRDYLVRLGRHGATHVSGTPSHWRRALMCPSARAMAPRYVRLSEGPR